MKKFIVVIMMLVALCFPFYLFSQDISGLISKSNQFVALLKDGKYSQATEDFDTKMNAALPAKKLQAIWEKLQTQVGILNENLGIRTEKLGNYDIIFVVCKFEKSNLDVKIVFNRDKQIAGLFFVPSKGLDEWKAAEYVDQDSFSEIEITRLSDEWPLPATLSLPKGDGPFVAVILVHGSGPSDRDESVGPNKPFRDLAWGLASKGIAVLRYEKRTKFFAGKMKSMNKSITVKEETIDDVIAAVTLLRKREKIDMHKIIVLGHSLGAMLAPRIAALDSRIAGFIMMAGAARPLEDLILEQYEYIFSLQDSVTAEQQKQFEEIKRKVRNVKNLKTDTDIRSKELPFNVPASYWLDLKQYDIISMAKNIKAPLFILQGQRDYQVTMTDFKIWQETFAGYKNTTLKLYSSLNHLFISGTGKITPEEYAMLGHVDKEVISDIYEWIRKNF